jgi:polysaccharide export outer membrane protein
LAGAVSCLCACQSVPNLPAGKDAYEAISPVSAATVARPYKIGPLDMLTIRVFREPELTLESVQVDSGGSVRVPLLGSLSATDKTPDALGDEIANRLRGRYLEDPQVTVLVKESSSQTVTVIGSVTEPGIYKLQGPSSLLDALALAKGTTRISDLKQVVVFRTIENKRMGALFNVRMIQRGEAPDPEILGRDTVVVGVDHLEAAWRDALLAAPLLAVFTTLY